MLPRGEGGYMQSPFRTLRQELGIRPEDLARALGVHYRRLWELERARVADPSAELARLSELGLQPERLAEMADAYLQCRAHLADVAARDLADRLRAEGGGAA